MHSARVVVLIVAVACACDLCHVSGVPTTKNRSRNIFAILKAGNGLANQQKENYPRQNSIPYSSTSGNSHALPSKRSDIGVGEGSDSREKEPMIKEEEPILDDEVDINDGSYAYVRDRNSPILTEGLEKTVTTELKPINFLRRAARSSNLARPYDVPIIECPPADDQMERFPCPRPDRKGRYRCIDDHVLCDGFIDCPDGMDEDRQQCMFYKTTKAHLDVIADAIIRFIRGRK